MYHFFLCSTWNLIHKESTAFGPTLTVSVVIEAPQTETAPTQPPSSSNNEDLLKSIGFLPTDKKESETLTQLERMPSYPTDFQIVPTSGEVENVSSGDPPAGATAEHTSALPAFVMVENPCSAVVSLSSSDSLHQTAPPVVDSDGE